MMNTDLLVFSVFLLLFAFAGFIIFLILVGKVRMEAKGKFAPLKQQLEDLGVFLTYDNSEYKDRRALKSLKDDLKIVEEDILREEVSWFQIRDRLKVLERNVHLFRAKIMHENMSSRLQVQVEKLTKNVNARLISTEIRLSHGTPSEEAFALFKKACMRHQAVGRQNDIITLHANLKAVIQDLDDACLIHGSLNGIPSE